MSFTFQAAKMLVSSLKEQNKTVVTRQELSIKLREITNTMDARWIKNFMQSMVTAGLLSLNADGTFSVL